MATYSTMLTSYFTELTSCTTGLTSCATGSPATQLLDEAIQIADGGTLPRVLFMLCLLSVISIIVIVIIKQIGICFNSCGACWGTGPAIWYKGSYPPVFQWDLQTVYRLSTSHNHQNTSTGHIHKNIQPLSNCGHTQFFLPHTIKDFLIKAFN